MNANDRNKIKAAGFRIFRMRRVYPIDRGPIRNSIWELSEKGSWCLYQNYQSRAAMERAWNDLMKDSKNVGEGLTEEKTEDMPAEMSRGLL